MSINQVALRQAFKAVQGAYKLAGRDPIITPSDLRLEILIKQNVTTYQFFVVSQEANAAFTGGASNTEIRLNQNDDFWAVLAGMYVAKPGSATDAEYILYSYPNPTKFTAAIAAPLQAFFNNGVLNISINNVAYIQNFATVRFRKVQIAQEGLGATSSTAVPAAIPSTAIDSFDGNDDGMTSLGTLIQMSGQKKMKVELAIPAGLSVAPAGTERIVLYFRGYLALNAAVR